MKNKTILGLEFGLYYSPNRSLPKEHEGTPYLHLSDNHYYTVLNDYCLLLGTCYSLCREANNIDGWLWNINEQIFLKRNQEYYGDNVCVFFTDDKVKLINYWDYEAGKENYCELTVEELRKLTTDWKWFVVEWEIKKIKGEI
ncbi:MAG TPA: hypothetical protein VIM65_05900 [Cyclobacteriaceae bacterium]